MKKLILLAFIALSLFGSDFENGLLEFEKGNMAKAVELFKKACDGGDAFGCSSLGFMYANGQGILKQ